MGRPCCLRCRPAVAEYRARRARQRVHERGGQFGTLHGGPPVPEVPLAALMAGNRDLVACQRGSASYFTHTVFGSVKNRSASSPPSRPTPLCLTPPNGVRRSRSSQQFTHTVPHSNRSDTRMARPRSRV